ncbi:hypothetical protein D3870_19860 [Noviherbaspirillum cavernae]|uniref:Uncharacterized protein n=1 Tax=Noviherbaspirillum cavernae TaxID=2320862 RepID=A0A418WVD6_9BURK|nr:hypothetical protein [Noviherbaspirillum cavernae]RJF96674.1 hypothetical protein D3870_19860 [Noviherbaspirillum cavernae]
MLDVAIDRSIEDTDWFHCDAYNAAFYELGLGWHWDTDTYRNLLPDSAGASDRIRSYLEVQQPHLLKAYDADFLIEAIQMAKARCYDTMRTCGHRPAPNMNWAEIQRVQIGI